eukprot:scaffold37301_cov47-Attheya_sp.AAC.1
MRDVCSRYVIPLLARYPSNKKCLKSLKNSHSRERYSSVTKTLGDELAQISHSDDYSYAGLRVPVLQEKSGENSGTRDGPHARLADDAGWRLATQTYI